MAARHLGRRSARRLAPLAFVGTALIVQVVARRHSAVNADLVAVCVAGLLGGAGAGAGVGAATLLLSLALGPPDPAAGLAAAAAGLAAGAAGRLSPARACRPGTGFAFGLLASLARLGLLAATGSAPAGAEAVPAAALTALANGAGVALVLAVVAQVRAREAEAQAAARAEVRALQARMNPHFLFNALNTVAALARIDPAAVPAVVARLGRFLRWSLDQDDRPLVPLADELAVVTAYLGIESLRLGDRLRVEACVQAGVLDALVPPLTVQPLVENAVRHGIEPREDGGRVRYAAEAGGRWLVVTVSDTGVGFPGGPAGDPGGPDAHALSILHRRLTALYGADAGLTIESRPGEGSTVTLRVPLAHGPPSQGRSPSALEASHAP